VGINQPFYLPKSHSKNACWVSTSLFIPAKVILKMPGGYPPAFLRTNTTLIKMPGGYPPAFLFAKSHSKNAWWVSTSLFIRKKSF
jgi:hypothetical protein